MQKLKLEQKFTQKFSGQQIKFVKLLQVPTIALNAYISKEVTSNPLLDDVKELENNEEVSITEEEVIIAQNFSDYYPNDFKKKYSRDNDTSRDRWMPTILSFQEKLRKQLYLIDLSEINYMIGEHLIGSLDQNGYLQHDLRIIVQDLNVMHYVAISLQEVEKVLQIIQRLNPPGIAARNLQECLLIQLQRERQEDPIIQLAERIVRNCFNELTKKHYEAIIQKLAICNRDLLKSALAYIGRLNPKPGSHNNGLENHHDFLIPDFIIVENNKQLMVELLNYSIHKPCLNKKYLAMLEHYEQKTKQTIVDQEMIAFLKKKLEDAKWFIEALSQRNHTLLKTMEAILYLQYDFFLKQEEVDKLTPMVLQNVADKVSMDASTISRIVNQKSVQGKFGIYPLKFFFSEGISNDSGEEISNKAVQNKILEFINKENKKKPYPDEIIGALLRKEGYHVARRTVAKYREKLNLPVARLRKMLE